MQAALSTPELSPRSRAIIDRQLITPGDKEAPFSGIPVSEYQAATQHLVSKLSQRILTNTDRTALLQVIPNEMFRAFIDAAPDILRSMRGQIIDAPSRLRVMQFVELIGESPQEFRLNVAERVLAEPQRHDSEVLHEVTEKLLRLDSPSSAIESRLREYYHKIFPAGAKHNVLVALGRLPSLSTESLELARNELPETARISGIGAVALGVLLRHEPELGLLRLKQGLDRRDYDRDHLLRALIEIRSGLNLKQREELFKLVENSSKGEFIREGLLNALRRQTDLSQSEQQRMREIALSYLKNPYSTFAGVITSLQILRPLQGESIELAKNLTRRGVGPASDAALTALLRDCPLELGPRDAEGLSRFIISNVQLQDYRPRAEDLGLVVSALEQLFKFPKSVGVLEVFKRMTAGDQDDRQAARRNLTFVFSEKPELFSKFEQSISELSRNFNRPQVVIENGRLYHLDPAYLSAYASALRLSQTAPISLAQPLRYTPEMLIQGVANRIRLCHKELLNSGSPEVKQVLEIAKPPTGQLAVLVSAKADYNGAMTNTEVMLDKAGQEGMVPLPFTQITDMDLVKIGEMVGRARAELGSKEEPELLIETFHASRDQGDLGTNDWKNKDESLRISLSDESKYLKLSTKDRASLQNLVTKRTLYVMVACNSGREEDLSGQAKSIDNLAKLRRRMFPESHLLIAPTVPTWLKEIVYIKGVPKDAVYNDGESLKLGRASLDILAVPKGFR